MSEGPGRMMVEERALMQFQAHKADVVSAQARARTRKLLILNMCLFLLMLGTVAALGAVSELPAPAPQDNGWYKILAGGSAQAVLAAALLVVTGALAVVSRLLYRVQSDRLTEVKSILQDCVLKSNETMARHTEILERVEKKL